MSSPSSYPAASSSELEYALVAMGRREPSKRSRGGCSGCEEAGTVTRRPLFQGLGVRIDDFLCRAHAKSRSAEEPNPTHSIVFVRRGLFTRTDRGGTIVADANQILFFNRDQGYRYEHPLPGGDDCTILALDDECAWDLCEGLAQPRSGSAIGPFHFGCAPSTPRAARLHHELLALAQPRGAPLPLAAEEVVSELIDEAMRALPDAAGASPHRGGPRSARRRETVEAAKLALNRSIAAPPSLVELARALDCSPFHLSRIFRAATGLGLRHYVSRLRARLAAERLARGARDLTDLALELGFWDHSHFTNAFRREWGVPPSRLHGTCREPRVE